MKYIIEIELLRRSLNQIDNSKDEVNYHHKDILVTFSTNKTNCSAEVFDKQISIINAMLNKRFVSRKYYKREDRIMMYSYLEISPQKELLHSHMMIRTPRFLLYPHQKMNEIFQFVRKKILPKFRFSLTLRKRPNVAIDYMTKDFNEKSDLQNCKYKVY